MCAFLYVYLEEKIAKKRIERKKKEKETGKISKLKKRRRHNRKKVKNKNKRGRKEKKNTQEIQQKFMLICLREKRKRCKALNKEKD